MCSSELRHGVSSKERQDGLGELRKHKAVWACILTSRVNSVHCDSVHIASDVNKRPAVTMADP